MDFWKIIVETNTFNFAILLLIFVILYQKLNVSALIENIKSDIINAMESVKNQKALSQDKLKNAQELCANLENEINDRLNDAKIQAQGIAERIENNAKLSIDTIEKNIQKIIDSQEKNIIHDISQNTLQKSVDLAKNKIIQELKNKQELHSKLIDESIEAI